MSMPVLISGGYRMVSFDDFKITFDYAMNRNETFLFACNCSIIYSGRAESFLAEGDRVVIIKSDKTLLVHQPEGNNPINYMKQESSHDIIRAESAMILKSRNLPLKEYLDITIHKIHFFNSHPLEDGKSIQLSGTEKDMSDMIFRNPSLISPFFKPLTREEHTKYGFVDVLGYEDKLLTVVECKRYCGDPKAVDQLRRYVEIIKKTKGVEKVQGVLACPKISPRAEKMLADYGFGFVTIKPPKYMDKFDKDQTNLDSFE